MADKKISALPAATTPLAGTEVLPIVQGGVTDQVSVANLTAGRDMSAKVITATDNVVIGTAGKGIDFSASTHTAGMTSELLNDYEEGDWTPNQGPGLTVVGAFSSSGKYTKIGRMVTVTGSLVGATSIACSAGGSPCTNLPFTVLGSSSGAATVGTVNQGSTVLAFNVQLYMMTAITATSNIDFTVTYFV